jgi:NitT/TauT family transport system substrate-binding protein
MRRARFGRVNLVAIAGLVALLVSACGSSGTQSTSGGTASSGGLEKSTITVAALPIVDTVGLFIAKKEGFFQQEGLSVNVKTVAQSTAAISAMLAGSVDVIGGGNYVSFFEGDAHGAFKIRILVDGTSCGHHTFSVLAMPKSGIKSPADLAGKTVAVNLLNNIQTLMLNAVLKADNVDPTKVHYVVIPFPNMATALQTGKVDAISVVEPFLTGAEQSLGATEVMDQCVGAESGMPLSGYFATQAWAQKYPNTARAFQRAVDKGQALADSNRALVEQVLPTYTKINTKAAALIALNSFPTTLDAMRLQRVANLMQSGGLLTTQFNVAPLLFR